MASSAIRKSIYRHWISRPRVQRKPSSPVVEPWLMVKEGGVEKRLLNFYSIVDEQDVSVPGVEDVTGVEDAIVVGSSHGWLALYKRRLDFSYLDMFLYNPLHYSTIHLPCVETLPIPRHVHPRKVLKPTKVILSCSPGDNYGRDCRAVMSFGPEDRLACCCPGRTEMWTPIGENHHDIKHRSCYVDFVYSRRRKQLFCTTKLGNIESWDLRDPTSPTLNWKMNEYTTKMIKKEEEYLVFAEGSNRLFLVRRNQTAVGFDVDELIVDDDSKGVEGKRSMECTLDGMAFFISSTGHGFVVEPKEDDKMMIKNVEADTIYYTNTKDNICCIFNYKNKTIAPCYYPTTDCDDTTLSIHQAPTWYFPSFVYKW